jgi:hypothetical protein
VSEQFLDLAQVRASTQELGGEDVAQRVRGDPLALVDAARVDLVAEHLTELGVVEPISLHADEDRPLGQWHEGAVDGTHPPTADELLDPVAGHRRSERQV